MIQSKHITGDKIVGFKMNDPQGFDTRFDYMLESGDTGYVEFIDERSCQFVMQRLGTLKQELGAADTERLLIDRVFDIEEESGHRLIANFQFNVVI